MARSFKLTADGGSRGNPGPAAYGTVVRDGLTGVILAEVAEYLGVSSRTIQAEWAIVRAWLRRELSSQNE